MHLTCAFNMSTRKLQEITTTLADSTVMCEDALILHG